MKCFSVDVCSYSIILCFSDCHDSTCAFLIVMLILIYALFYSTCDYFCVCKMLFFFFFFFLAFVVVVVVVVVVMLILMYAFIVLVLFLIVKRILMLIMYSAASL